MEAEWNRIVEFKQASHVVRTTSYGTMVNKFAQGVVNELGGQSVTYEVKCLLCGAKYPFETTVREAVTFVDEPKGVCGKHDKKNGEPITLIQA